jgi:hypothetical protein
MQVSHIPLRQKLAEGRISDETAEQLKRAISTFKRQFLASADAKRRMEQKTEGGREELDEQAMENAAVTTEVEHSAGSVPGNE